MSNAQTMDALAAQIFFPSLRDFALRDKDIQYTVKLAATRVTLREWQLLRLHRIGMKYAGASVGGWSRGESSGSGFWRLAMGGRELCTATRDGSAGVADRRAAE